MHDSQKVEQFIKMRGITRISSLWDPEFKNFPRNEYAHLNFKPDWAKGLKHKPMHRYNLAKSWASVRGLAEVAWTDVKEALLIEMRKQGMSYTQIGKQMGKSKASIASRVRYLRLGRRL